MSLLLLQRDVANLKKRQLLFVLMSFSIGLCDSFSQSYQAERYRYLRRLYKHRFTHSRGIQARVFQDKIFTQSYSSNVCGSSCCEGWGLSRDGTCSIPICRMRCLNGGVCSSPNKCRCRPRFSGRTCSVFRRSSLSPSTYSRFNRVRNQYRPPRQSQIVSIYNPPRVVTRPESSSTSTSFRYFQPGVSQQQLIKTKYGRLLGTCYRWMSSSMCGGAFQGKMIAEMCCLGLGQAWGPECLPCSSISATSFRRPPASSKSKVRCPNGYRRIGYKCCDINECTRQPVKCNNGKCLNIRGSYYCRCDSGYRAGKDKKSCLPVAPSIPHSEKCYIRLDYEGKCPSHPQIRASKFACCCSIGVAWGSRCELCPPVGSDERNKFCVFDLGYSKAQPDQENILVIDDHRTVHPNLTHFSQSRNKTVPLPTITSITGSSTTPTEKNVEIKSLPTEVKKQEIATTLNTNRQFTTSLKTTKTTGYYPDISKELPTSNKQLIGQKTSTASTSQFFSSRSPTDKITTHSSSFPAPSLHPKTNNFDETSTIKEPIAAAITFIRTETETTTHSTAHDVTIATTVLSTQPVTTEQVPSSTANQSTIPTTPRPCDMCLNEGTCITLANSGDSTFVCNCTAAFQGERCEEDIDECSTSSLCEEGTCVNDYGSFHCECPIGYELDSIKRSCKDINECTNKPCFDGSECINTAGSYYCKCDDFSYYNKMFRQCISLVSQTSKPIETTTVPEKRYSRLSCYSDANVCVNQIASNTTIEECCCTLGKAWGACLSCPALNTEEYRKLCPGGRGYVVKNRSIRLAFDADECVIFRPKEICPNARCVNTVGSFQCNCNRGYYFSNRRQACQDFNECLLVNMCGSATCENLPGSFRCVCPPGMVFEIKRREKTCVSAVMRSSTRSSITTAASSTTTSLTNRPRIKPTDPSKIQKPNNGPQSSGSCYARAISDSICTAKFSRNMTRKECCCNFGKAWGSECLKCPTRNSRLYHQLCNSGGSKTSCGKWGSCDNGRCIPTPRGAQCVCNTGYRRSPSTKTCEDINECRRYTNRRRCGNGGLCVNTEGSFQCNCMRGYQLSSSRKTCIRRYSRRLRYRHLYRRQ